MGRKLFVGNLSYDTTDADLRQLFGRVGTCDSAAVIMDRNTGRSRGFGFVEMGSEEEAERALAELQDYELQGRKLNLSEARERAPRGPDRGFPPPRAPFRKEHGSRRGLRAKKRSLN